MSKKRKTAWKGTIPDGDAKIWRYMDFAKLLSLLDKKALYFSRADKLGDPFEGSFPKANVEKRQGVFTTEASDLTTLSEFYRLFVRLTVVSCWHLNEHESDAMWKLYLRDGNGIALQTTVGRLISSLENENRDTVNVFKVEYKDYDTTKIPEGTLSPYFHKRLSFEHERELRAVIQRLSRNKNGEIDFDKTPFHDGGLYVHVDIEKLIERVYLSPTCPVWQRGILDSLLRKYGLNRHARQSRLIDEPQY